MSEIIKLAPTQWRFVNEYIIDLNGTQAAIRAGYSPATAKSQASRLLTNVNVRAAVTAAIDKHFATLDLDLARIIREAARVGIADPGDLFAGTHVGHSRDHRR